MISGSLSSRHGMSPHCGRRNGLQYVGQSEQGIIFFYKEKESKIINWEQDFLYTTESYLQLTELFVSDMSHIVLRGRWCNIIVLNVHAPSEEKNVDSEDSINAELQQVFHHFPKYHMNILL